MGRIGPDGLGSVEPGVHDPGPGPSIIPWYVYKMFTLNTIGLN